MLRFIFPMLIFSAIGSYAQERGYPDSYRVVKDAPGLRKGEFYRIKGLDTILVEDPIASNSQAVEKGEDTVRIKNPNTGKTETFVLVDQMPEAPYDILAYLAKNIHYPDEAGQRQIGSKIKVQFIVQTDGSITDVKVIKGLHPVLDLEVIRAISSMPAWNPARKDNIPVPCRYTLPVIICAE